MSAELNCRVCLIDGNNLYNVVNTSFEELYENLTNTKLQKHGHPSCLCLMCLSALRRCGKFIECAQESNNKLEQWCRNEDDVKLVKRPLFSLIKTSPELVEITSDGILEPTVKYEPDTAGDTENNGIYNGMVHQIQFENDSDDEELRRENYRGYEYNSTQLFTDEIINKHAFENINNNKQASEENENECYSKNKDVSDENIFTQALSDENDSKQASGESKVISKSINENDYREASDENHFTEANHKQVTNVNDFTLEWDSENDNIEATDKNDFTLEWDNEKETDILTNFKGTKTNKRNNLKRHFENKPFKCVICNFKSDKKGHLNRHLVVHSGEKPFECDKCNFRTNRKETLKTHIVNHTCDHMNKCNKRFACDKCNFLGSRLCILKQHLKTHTDVKPFACDKCNYKTNRKGNLLRHVKRHTGEKPFVCHECGYRTTTIHILRVHLMKHTGEKPFACDKCKYKCSRQDVLKRHIKTHGSEKTVGCKL